MRPDTPIIPVRRHTPQALKNLGMVAEAVMCAQRFVDLVAFMDHDQLAALSYHLRAERSVQTCQDVDAYNALAKYVEARDAAR